MRDTLPLVEVQHHHAHVAACLAENGRPLDAPPVLGIVLDGLGWGDDGTIWGGEFLLADYRAAQRLGTLQAGGDAGRRAAVREPWRNLYAHLMAEMGWAQFAMNFAELELFRDLDARPRAHARRDDPERHQCAAGVVVRPAVRRGGGGARALLRCPAGLMKVEAAARLEALVDARHAS